MAVAAESKRLRTPRFVTPGSARLWEAVVGYAFVAVPLLFFGLFFLFPIGYALYISFYDWGILGYVGGQNYRDLWHDPLFVTWPPKRATAMGNTLYYTVIVVPAQMALGLALALAVNARIRGKAFFRAAYYFPSLTGSVAIAAI